MSNFPPEKPFGEFKGGVSIETGFFIVYTAAKSPRAKKRLIVLNLTNLSILIMTCRVNEMSHFKINKDIIPCDC